MTERLPILAKWYIALVAICACIGLYFANNFYDSVKLGFNSVLVVSVAAYFAGRRTINIASGLNRNENASISIGFIVILVSIIYFGGIYGFIAAFCSLINTRKSRLKYYQYIFNVSSLAISVFITELGITCANRYGFDLDSFTRTENNSLIRTVFTIVSCVTAVLLYHLVNATLITGAVSLSMRWKWIQATEFFRKNTLWIAPVYLIASCFVILIIWVFKNVEHEAVHVLPLCLVIIPLPWLFFHNIKLHRERDLEREARFRELESLYSSMVQAMGRAIEAKDKYTQEHISRVVAISMGIGRKVGLNATDLRSLEVGAALHDIGKIAIPEDILNKPGKLTTEEFQLVQQHAALGSEILQPVPFPPEVVEAVRHHHEKWDGTGYPDRLAGEDIPLVARIVAVADVYDALTSDRPYRAAWSHERAMSFLRDQVGKHFDQEVFKAFEKAMDAEPELRTTAVEQQEEPVVPLPKAA